MKKRIALIFGTRPEAIKMAPVYLALKNSSLEPIVIATAQHREMLDQILNLFKIKPDYDLNIMKERQSLSGLTSRLTAKIDEVYKKENFSATLVQGDTTSTFVGSLVSFYHKIPVGHVEAGLRTDNIYNPFPEEVNRRLNSVISTYHYTPTEKAKENLLKENTNEQNILVTGNTVIDALLCTLKEKSERLKKIREKLGIENTKYILMTMHRRENWGKPMKDVMKAVKEILYEKKDYKLLFPVHLNPAVREIVYEELKGHENIILTDPLDYLPFISVMERAQLILTDSGGIQEEAPSLGIPTLVLRETTERPEAIEGGTAKLVGTDKEKVKKEALLLLNDEKEYKKMSGMNNPFGDGKASERIRDHLEKSV